VGSRLQRGLLREHRATRSATRKLTDFEGGRRPGTDAQSTDSRTILEHWRARQDSNLTVLAGPRLRGASAKTVFAVNVARSVWSCRSQSCVQARGGRIGGNGLDLVGLMEGRTVRDASASPSGVVRIGDESQRPGGVSRHRSRHANPIGLSVSRCAMWIRVIPTWSRAASPQTHNACFSVCTARSQSACLPSSWWKASSTHSPSIRLAVRRSSGSWAPRCRGIRPISSPPIFDRVVLMPMAMRRRQGALRIPRTLGVRMSACAISLDDGRQPEQLSREEIQRLLMPYDTAIVCAPPPRTPNAE